MQVVGGFKQRNISFLIYHCLILWLQHGFAGASTPRCTDPSTGRSLHYSADEDICCLGNVHKRKDVYTECCGTSVFNSLVEVCCNGNVSRRNEGATECCGIQPYDLSLSTCCYNNGRESLHPGIGECCGSQGFFDPSHHVCCHSYTESLFQLHLIPDGGHYQCCGSDLYDITRETCCRETVFPGVKDCCGSTPFDSDTELCCDGSIHTISEEASACCGDVPYNSATKTCCYGTVYDIAGGSCCWSSAYDPLTSSCCGYQVNTSLPEVPGIQDCCGSQSYLMTEEICCSGQLFPREEYTGCCSDAVYDTSTQLCCGEWYEEQVVLDKTTNNTSCCGSVTFEEDRETCCPRTSQVFPLVNGDCCLMVGGKEEAFDPATGICCSDIYEETFYPLYPGYSAHEYQCCGSHLLYDDELCDPYNQVPVRKSSSNDDSVCPGETDEQSQTYNSVSSMCVNGVLIPLDVTQGICGNQLMDMATEICCLDIFIHARYDGNANERKCCEDSLFAYSPSEESCCGTVIYDIPEDEASCCEYQAYRTSTEVCEDGYIIPKGKPHRCGDQYYNAEESVCCGDSQLVGAGYTCCDGAIYYTNTDGINTGSCCGGVGYNPSTHICCGTMVHERSRQDLECCGNEAINPKQRRRHICCGGVLQSTNHGRKQCQGQVAFNPKQETVCGDVRHPVPYATCCGSHLLNEDTEICCGDQIFTKNGSTSLACCGADVYDLSDPTQLCCDTVLHHGAADQSCCGTHIYDPLYQKCCHGELHSLIYWSQEDQHHCCGDLLFNASKHQCCSGTLHQFRTGYPCCGAEVMLGNDQMCCEGNLNLKLYGDSTTCCGREIYDEAYETCVIEDGIVEVVRRSGSRDRANSTVQQSAGFCLDSPSEVTSEMLTQAYITHTTVVMVGPLKIKTKKGKPICKSRIAKVLKHYSNPNDMEGTPILFGPHCPCEGFKKPGVLFTNQGFSGDRFSLREGDILMKSSKWIRQALDLLDLKG